MIAQAVRTAQRDLDGAVAVFGWRLVVARDRSGEDHGVVGVVGGSQPDVDVGEHAAGARPVGQVPADQPVGRDDVHEDVLRPAGHCQPVVMVDVLIIAGGDGRRDDQGAGERDLEDRQGVTDLGVLEAQGRRARGRRLGSRRHGRAPVEGFCRTASTTWRPRRAKRALDAPSMSSSCFPHRK